MIIIRDRYKTIKGGRLVWIRDRLYLNSRKDDNDKPIEEGTRINVYKVTCEKCKAKLRMQL